MSSLEISRAEQRADHMAEVAQRWIAVHGMPVSAYYQPAVEPTELPFLSPRVQEFDTRLSELAQGNHQLGTALLAQSVSLQINAERGN